MISFMDFEKFLSDVNDSAKNNLHVKKNDIVVVYLLAMYYRAINLSEEILSFIRDNKPEFASIMARTLLEVYVDFMNLVKEPKFLLHLMDENKRSKNIIISNLNRLGFGNDGKDFNYWNKRYKKINIIEKFKNIGMNDLYTIYREFCSDTHNSIISLRKSHIVYSEENVVIKNKSSKKGSGSLVINKSYQCLKEMSFVIHFMLKTGLACNFRSPGISKKSINIDVNG